MDFAEALLLFMAEESHVMRRPHWPDGVWLEMGQDPDGQPALVVRMSEGRLPWGEAGKDVLADDWSVVAIPAEAAAEDDDGDDVG